MSAALFMAGACVVVGGAIAVWKARRVAQPSPLPDVARQIIDARATAHYDRALRLVAEASKSHPGQPAIRTLAEEFQQDLKPDIRLQYMMRGAFPLRTPRSGSRLQLTPNDEFYYTVDLRGIPRPCYLYMFLVDSASNWSVLLPNKAHVPNGNPLPPARFQVPDNIRKRLRPASTPGAEKLFAVAAYWRIDALEGLAAALATETNAERARALGQQLLARLRLEEAAADGIPGLAFGTSEFHSSGLSPVQEFEKP